MYRAARYIQGKEKDADERCEWAHAKEAYFTYDTNNKISGRLVSSELSDLRGCDRRQPS